jgi:hypothetical protein
LFIQPRETHRSSLEKLFDRKPIAQITELRRALSVRSRTTVFFALKAAGYLTSYSHAGRYYTLSRVPKFDAHGLWAVGGVRFSKHGTLRATIVVSVCEAPAGCTHEELAELLGLRVHDTLRSLVEAHALGREQVQAVYVYLHPDADRAEAQLAERRRKTAAPVPEPVQGTPPPLAPTRVIDVLVAVIHAPKEAARAIAARLRAAGLAVSAEQVAAVFAQYGLEKKTARFRSARSRR